MTDNLRGWWVARVTFERQEGASNDVLPPDSRGAVGWMACRTDDGDDVRDLIKVALRAGGLRLVEIEVQALLRSRAYLQALDAQLADNVNALEPGKRVVWGTIYPYLADGEA